MNKQLYNFHGYQKCQNLPQSIKERVIALYFQQVCLFKGNIPLISVCSCEICADKPDGVYETNCRAYSICIGGKEEIVNCEIGQAFNTKTKQCDK